MICPKCNTEVKNTLKSCSCQCTTIWKEMSGRTIGKELAIALLEKGQTKVLEGFVSKASKHFKAALVIEGGKVVFRFPDNSQTRQQGERASPPSENRQGYANTVDGGQAQDDSTLRVRVELGSSGTVWVSAQRLATG